MRINSNVRACPTSREFSYAPAINFLLVGVNYVSA